MVQASLVGSGATRHAVLSMSRDFSGPIPKIGERERERERENLADRDLPCMKKNRQRPRLVVTTDVFTARCTLVQSAVLRSHVVCLSVCDVGEL